MTISSEAIKAGPFSGNDSTTVFSFTFKCFAQGDLKVVLTNSSGVDATLTITTDYTVALNANQDTSPGGSITTTGSSSPPDTGEKLTILNEPAYTQGTDLITGGGFYPDVVETALDRSTVLARRAKEQVGRSVQIPVSDSAGTTVLLPTNTLRANKALVFDADGDVGVSVDNYVDQTTASAASAATASAAATAAQSAASAVAIPFLMDTSTTMGDPAGTNFRLNNATISSVSLIAFGDTSKDGVDVSDYLMTWDDSTSTINGHLLLVQEGTPANWAVFTVGTMSDNSDWVQCTVTHVDSGGSLFTNDSTVRCQFIRAGDKGDTGNTGATGATGSGEGLEMTFESTTTDTDQGAGKVWLNHGTASSATIVYMDDVDANAANINSLIDSWDDSTSTSLKGRITIKKQVAPENYIIYTFAGAVTSASTYSKLTSCVHVASAGTIADTDAVFVTFSRVGDKGDTGNTGATGAQGASPGIALLWDTDTSDADSGAGKIFGNHGTFASISQLYIDDVDSAGTNIEAWIQSMDDSTTTSARGTITLVKTTAQTQIGVFTVTGAVVDGTGYWKIPCSHVFSNVGSLADGDAVTVVFTRTGNIGATGSTGSTGSTGAQGPTGVSAGLPFRFNSATADSDKDAGDFWYNASVGSATIVYLDDADSDGNAVSAITDTWDDGGSATHRGFLFVKQDADPSNMASFKVTGSIVDASGYSKVTVALLASNGTISNNDLCHLEFSATGTGGIANRTVDTMTGDNSDDTLSLSQSPGSENNVSITFDGVMQHHDTYSLSGSTITFSTAPATGVKVEAVTGGLEAIGTPSDGTVTLAKMTANSIDSDQYVDGSIDLIHLSADCVDGTKIADDAIDSEHYVDGSIDNAHIADNAIDSEHYAAASIDAEHLAVGKDGALSLDATPDTDHTAHGPQTSTLNAGYSSTIMDLVYLNANGKWLEADADAAGTSINLLGMALESKTDGQAMNVALAGSFVRDDTWNWTIGVPLYVSGTIGEITETKPSGSGDVVRTVGYSVTADVIFFNPSSDYVTLA